MVNEGDIKEETALSDSETSPVGKARAAEIIGSDMAQTCRGRSVYLPSAYVSVYTADYTVDVHIRLNVDRLYI